MDARQTATYLSKRLSAAGLRPVSRFGQNFLVDLNLVDLIAKSAALQKSDTVLEIGTGMGSLTSRLSDHAGAVLSVEIDNHLHQLAGEELEGRDNIKLIHGDALHNKNSLRPEIMQHVRHAMGQLSQTGQHQTGQQGRFLLVANLPYNIATPIISNLLHEEPTPDVMVVTIQKELGDRIVAQPGSKDYGALSVWIQSLCNVEVVRVLPPTVFWPRPKVHSAILRLEHQPDRRAAFPDLKHFHTTTRALFFHRRKFLRSVTISAMKGRLTKPQVDAVLDRLGHKVNVRAEQLNVPQIQELAEALRLAELAPDESASDESASDESAR